MVAEERSEAAHAGAVGQSWGALPAHPLRGVLTAALSPRTAIGIVLYFTLAPALATPAIDGSRRGSGRQQAGLGQGFGFEGPHSVEQSMGAAQPALAPHISRRRGALLCHRPVHRCLCSGEPGSCLGWSTPLVTGTGERLQAQPRTCTAAGHDRHFWLSKRIGFQTASTSAAGNLPATCQLRVRLRKQRRQNP